MRERAKDRRNRERSIRNRQLDRVTEGFRDLRAVDEQVSIEPIEEDTDEEATDELEEEKQNPEDRSEVEHLRFISRGVDHTS